MCRRFLWTSKEDARRTTHVSWEKTCYPIAEGCLNVISLGMWNQATLGKMMWNLCQKKDRLWIYWVHQYYMKQGSFTNFMPKMSASWIMKALFKHKMSLMNTEAWKDFEVTGSFKTGVMYKELKFTNPKVPWKDLIRGNMTWPRSIFILWMTCQNRLQTKDRLTRFGTMTD